VSDGEDCWLFFADAGPGAYSPACPAHRVLSGRWLATIHGIGLQSGLASRLPRRDPDYYLAELQPARATLRENFSNPFLPADDVANLRALVTDCDQLENQWREVEKICAPAPRTVVHGDFVLKNMRIRETPAGPAFWAFDWEHAGWGVPAVDLAQFTGHSASPDLKSYGQVLRAFVPGLDDTHLRQLAACGTLFRVLDAIAWESPSLSFRPYRYLSRTMAILGSYRARLHDALQAAGWARN
jgi:aminoglycoside phosphotransferase (APT) family kinase protein